MIARALPQRASCNRLPGNAASSSSSRLIAVVLMSLAAVALMRSVHTSTLVVGNLAFRQAAQSMAAAAVETAVYDMFPPTTTIADLKATTLARNYYATLQPGRGRDRRARRVAGHVSARLPARRSATDTSRQHRALRHRAHVRSGDALDQDADRRSNAK